MKRQLVHTYQDIIFLENLCLAWQEFIIGKKSKLDVMQFERSLMDGIVELHDALVNRTYKHGGYESFFISDPKRRHIHKAGVRDRLLHHAIYRILYPFLTACLSLIHFLAGMRKVRIKPWIDFAVWRIQSAKTMPGHAGYSSVIFGNFLPVSTM